MATKPKAILSTHDGREASPITKASNVLFENGQTAQDILNDRQDAMISPVIENSSSMFKVGQGDTVDYSANVVNGAYESMVLKGKSIVNCIQEPSSQDIVLPYEFEEGQYVTINDTKESGALGVELKGQTLVNLVKGENKVYTLNVDGTYKLIHINLNIALEINKKYYLSYRVITNTIAEGNFGLFVTNGSDHCGVHAQAKRNETGTMTYVGDVNKVADKLRVFAEPNCVSGTFEVTDVMLIEYQEGMENWNIPYLEGMTSCKMPILHTVGKNLFNHVPESLIGKTSYGMNVSISNGKIKITGTPTGTYGYVEIVNCVEKGKQYTFSAYENGQLATSGYRLWVRYSDGTLSNPTSGGTFVAKNLDIVRVEFVFEGFTVGTAVNKEVNIQIEESSSVTSYESYKSSILSLPEEVVLRSLPNGVCDTFNTRTGVYTQNVKEVTFNGSENWIKGVRSDTTVVSMFYLQLEDLLTNAEGDINDLFIDKIFTSQSHVIWDKDVEGIHNKRSCLYININNSRMSDVTIEAFKTWLSQNPITVQYQLVEPIITKINLPSTLKSWNTTTHIYSEIPENSLYPILSHSNPTYSVILKPSTKYSIVANSYSNNHTNSAINFNLGGATASTTVGNRVTTITTPSTLTSEELVMSGRGNKLNNVMVIEGDVMGDEPYFEGICDCKSPILSNVGANIFDFKAYQPYKASYSNGYPHQTGDSIINYIKELENGFVFTTPTNINHQGVCYYVKVKRKTDYHISCDVAFTGAYSIKIFGIYTNEIPLTTAIKDNHRHLLNRDNLSTNTLQGEFNTKDFDCLLVYLGGAWEQTVTGAKTITFTNIQIKELQTPYEVYKSNTTTFDQKDDKTIVLRSLPNGVCDTLNVETGEYVQRIGEVVLDKNNVNIRQYSNSSGQGLTAFVVDNLIPNNIRYSKVLCNSMTSEVTWSKENVFSNENGQLGISICIDKLVTNDVKGFKQYLQSNPITVQYELATPITKTINLQGSPYAYKDGHIQLTSGSIEQSLTPIIEYSAPTNRNGQIRSNQKMVEKHQKELDKLQAIILANLVNSQYNQTLTTLNYELSRV